MLMFGCRHHIADLLVKNVYYAIMKADPSPENQMFKRFRDNFRYVDTSGPVATLEVDNKDVLISFYTDMLLKKKKDGSVFHRDDYREAAKLALILIGGELPHLPRPEHCQGGLLQQEGGKRKESQPCF